MAMVSGSEASNDLALFAILAISCQGFDDKHSTSLDRDPKLRMSAIDEKDIEAISES